MPDPTTALAVIWCIGVAVACQRWMAEIMHAETMQDDIQFAKRLQQQVESCYAIIHQHEAP